MSAGQLVEDVRLATGEAKPVHLLAKHGGFIPTPEEIVEKIKELRSV
jgi:2-oxoglutarate ferredoxin oxidoreductase subunit alpha